MLLCLDDTHCNKSYRARAVTLGCPQSPADLGWEPRRLARPQRAHLGHSSPVMQQKSVVMQRVDECAALEPPSRLPGKPPASTATAVSGRCLAVLDLLVIEAAVKTALKTARCRGVWHAHWDHTSVLQDGATSESLCTSTPCEACLINCTHAQGERPKVCVATGVRLAWHHMHQMYMHQIKDCVVFAMSICCCARRARF